MRRFLVIYVYSCSVDTFFFKCEQDAVAIWNSFPDTFDIDDIDETEEESESRQKFLERIGIHSFDPSDEESIQIHEITDTYEAELDFSDFSED